jgi:predicted nucleic acid-binding protein
MFKMKIKLFLDTSIPSAPFDLTKPMRKHITIQWFENKSFKYDIYTSNLSIQELHQWGNPVKQQGALALLEKANVKILPITPEMEQLAEQYIVRGAFPITEKDDALHLACATLNDIQNFVSWDFKHIVSVNPILKIIEIHQKLKLPMMHINTLAPYGGDVYGTFEPEKFTKEKHKIDTFLNQHLKEGT